MTLNLWIHETLILGQQFNDEFPLLEAINISLITAMNSKDGSRINRMLMTVLCFQFVAFTNAFYTCPHPLCEICLSAQIHDAPGIGFDLNPSYG